MIEFLAINGYEQYEISNFARDEQYSKHNSNYWKGVPFLGIGPSAHSFDGIHRRWNIFNNTVIYLLEKLFSAIFIYDHKNFCFVQRINWAI